MEETGGVCDNPSMITKMAFLLTCFLVGFPVIARAEEQFPADVTAFVRNAEICQYLSGEWDSSLPEGRKDALLKEMNARCTNIHVVQEKLQRKYIKNKVIASKLNTYQF